MGHFDCYLREGPNPLWVDLLLGSELCKKDV